MSSGVRTWTTRNGLVGYVARGVVFGLIAWSSSKAAGIQREQGGRAGRSVRKLAHESYGAWLPASSPPGLFADGVSACSGRATARSNDEKPDHNKPGA